MSQEAKKLTKKLELPSSRIMSMFHTGPFVTFSSDEAMTSYVEFTVQKVSPRHLDPVRRTLCLSEMCIIERDPGTYNMCTLKPLSDVSYSANASLESVTSCLYLLGRILFTMSPKT